MRFRLSTLLLAATLLVVASWQFADWRQASLRESERSVASEVAQFKSHNDFCRSIDGTDLDPKDFRRRLQYTVKSMHFVLSEHKTLSRSTQRAVRQVATDALVILDVSSADEFRDLLVADGALQKLNWETRKPEYKRVLDANTHRLNPEFRAFLESVFKLKD